MLNQKQIRVLHTVYAMNTGGVESWLMEMYRIIDKENIQFDFLVNTKKKAFFDDEIKQLGGQIIYGGALNNPIKIFKITNAILANDDYYAVHCHNIENATPVLIAAKKNNIKVRILQSHNNLKRKVLQLGFLKSFYIKINRYLSLKYTNKLISVSKSAGDSLFKSKRFEIISLGIDVGKFSANCERAISKSDFNISNNDFVIGHVGRFDVQKNHIFIVEIAEELIKIIPNCKFLLIGNGELEEKIRVKIKDCKLENYFVFAGIRNDVPDIMNCIMDAFLFPSLSEGLGLVLVEAQISGLPIICSDVIPNEAFVNSDLIKKMSLSQSPKKWAEALIKNYNSNKHYDKEKAYGIIKNSPFNLNTTTQLLEEIWKGKK